MDGKPRNHPRNTEPGTSTHFRGKRNQAHFDVRGGTRKPGGNSHTTAKKYFLAVEIQLHLTAMFFQFWLPFQRQPRRCRQTIALRRECDVFGSLFSEMRLLTAGDTQTSRGVCVCVCLVVPAVFAFNSLERTAQCAHVFLREASIPVPTLLQPCP